MLVPPLTEALDFELEAAVIIGRECANVKADGAWEVVAGLTIMNDWSARDLQRKEMAIGLGPAKGKDFATSMGPWLVTLDELEDRPARRTLRPGHDGPREWPRVVAGQPV